MESLKILILGKGRIGQAIFHYLKKLKATKKVAFFSNGKEAKDCDLLIGALPGEVGEKSLEVALKYKKDLIDVSDLEPEFYLNKGKQIKRKGMTVIPGCGFCPGLINLILGRERAGNKNIKEIEIKTGNLSPKKFFFPFLWCFEDLIWEHQNPSWQIINGKKRKFPPFSGYQRENFLGIESETYFGQGGFENLIDVFKIRNFKFRIIRPFGFFNFSQFLENQGFLKKKNLETTKKILESQKEDNFTMAEIKILTKKSKIIWKIKSFSKKNEKLNSMQKTAGIMPAIILNLLSRDKMKSKGISFLEEIGKNKELFQKISAKLKEEGILINRKEELST